MTAVPVPPVSRPRTIEVELGARSNTRLRKSFTADLVGLPTTKRFGASGGALRQASMILVREREHQHRGGRAEGSQPAPRWFSNAASGSPAHSGKSCF
jgi:hypothetical protein